MSFQRSPALAHQSPEVLAHLAEFKRKQREKEVLENSLSRIHGIVTDLSIVPRRN